MITSRFNPGATTKAEPKPAMYHAWLYNNISTMAELAKYTQPSSMIRKTEVRNRFRGPQGGGGGGTGTH